ncbi:MAG: efflux RND transporter permease subunit [Planctomycetota bacterium]
MIGEQPKAGWSTLFFRNRHLLWLTVAVIVIGGLSSAVSLPRLEDPRIVNRGPLIITPMPGASAERVEALVTEPLEEALDEIDAIKNIDSTSRAGISMVSVELLEAVGADTNKEVFAEIRDKVSQASAELPPEAGEPFVDDKREAAAFTLIVGVTWDSETPLQAGLLGRLAEELGDRLRRVPGTDLVRIYGAPEEEITVEVDRGELAELRMSVADVAGLINAADTKLPAGALRTGQSDLLIEVDGELDTKQRITEVPVVEGQSGALLTVGDLATVERGWREPTEQIARFNGQRSVFVAARMSSGVRIDDWAKGADATVAAFEAERGGGVRIDRVFEQANYTNDRLGVLIETLLAGAGVIVIAVFLIMGLRPAIIVASALPLVVGLVLIGWGLTGTAVHQMSIFGLIIALGLLIDNAIVMTDDVIAYKAKGVGALEAVGRSVRHLAAPLLASTVTTVLAFAPIMLLPGSAGDFVGSIGTSVILAIIASYFVAIALIAALAGIFGKPTAPGAKRRFYRDGLGAQWMTNLYRRLLRRAFAMPVVAIVLAAALPLAGFSVAPTLGSAFFPPVDRNMFEVKVWLPSDNAIGSTDEQAKQIEATLRTLEGIEQVTWMVGSSHPTVYYNLIMDQDGSASYAHAIVTTDSPETTKRLVSEAQVLLDERHPGAQIVLRKFGQGPPVVADVEYRVFGPSVQELQAIGDRLRVALQKHPEVIHTQATLSRGEPKLFFAADEDEAGLAGLTLRDVANQMDAALEGSAVASVVEEQERLPVRVRYANAVRNDLDAVASIPLVTPATDRWINASSLGSFELRPELGGITRYNNERTNVIKAYTRDGSLPIDITNSVLADLEASGYELPTGYRIGFGGAAEQSGEANANLATYAPILAVMMVATLILVFRSVRYAIVLGAVAFFSVGLALLSTWSIGFPIGFNMILGTLGLIGVALNDSIVVLAAIREDPKASAGDLDAVVQSVIDSTRHIIATTATTVGGFLPLLLFVGGDFWPSLAIVLVGGIIGATLIALLFIPACYVIINRVKPTAPIATA